jgi:hypothetical protein
MLIKIKNHRSKSYYIDVKVKQASWQVYIEY